MPVNGSICVSNHTSPLDTLILSKKQPFSLTGQKYSDVFSYFQKSLAECGDHLWFDRFNINDKKHVVEVLEEHTRNKNKDPILVFPEGTCISNNAVMMFNKGSFEVPNAVIYPVAIKYDSRFADPFWNSSRYSLFHFIIRLATSWGLVCDVYYLPPQVLHEGETSIEFANRVKKLIASKGQFLNLDWNGQLKRIPPAPKHLQEQQKTISEMLVKYAE
ncbi:MAG: hypothetical protein MHPSP_002395 [Paramarteilia canceri]